MQGSFRKTEAELEDLLTEVMTVFKYIEDKDVFQKFYTKRFAQRLVGGIRKELPSILTSRCREKLVNFKGKNFMHHDIIFESLNRVASN